MVNEKIKKKNLSYRETYHDMAHFDVTSEPGKTYRNSSWTHDVKWPMAFVEIDLRYEILISLMIKCLINHVYLGILEVQLPGTLAHGLILL
jgi:hypothetical protein